MVKIYILDTNIILSDPYSMVHGFEDNEVVITSTTLQELDSKKRAGGETGYNARLCGKILDGLRLKGDLVKGIDNESGGITRIEPDGINSEYLPVGYSLDSPDNRIISTCIYIKKNVSAKNGKIPVILVTDDILMRISATASFSYAGVDIGVEGYENNHISDQEAAYKGYCEFTADKSIIDSFYKEKELEYDSVIPHIAVENELDLPVENEFFTFRCGSQSALTVYQKGVLKLIDPEQKLCGWVKPKNELQTYAAWLLKNKGIPLKILIGAAGTGKTFLSLAAGLDDTIGTKKHGSYYDKMLISRPVYGFGDVGFLPGDLDSKLEPLYAAFNDNLSVLLKRGEKEDKEQIKMQIEDMYETGLIEICGLSFIRGRSLIDTYFICDEAQNASPTLIRDIVSRAGGGSSIVLAGDTRQVDINNLDSHNNGLSYVSTKMAGSPLTGIIRFPAEASVRSPLAKEASERM